MSAVSALPQASPSLPEAIPRRDMLDGLREAALRAHCARRLELFQACAMLSGDRAQSHAAFRDALLRTLSQGLRRRPVLFRPGVPETSFDERWLLALIDSVIRDDAPSIRFLSASRIAAHARRSLLFLVAGLARHID